MTLNELTGSEYDFSKCQTHTPGIPDFNCHLVELLILMIEAKRKHVLEDMGKQTFFEFYQTSKGKDVIQQIYNYMRGNELKYSILTTCNSHWFLCREHTELWISKTLSLQSLTRQAKENSNSPKPQVLVLAHGDNNSRTLRSHSKSSSNFSLNQQQTSGTFANQQSSSNIPVDQQILVSVLIYQKPHIHPERNAERSQDLQRLHKYSRQVYSKVDLLWILWRRAVKGLEAIHKHGILHNDIREENILINDNGDVYLIDFRMANREDTKKKRKLFEEEHLKYTNLLDRYNA
ncbi:16525_t:CDS:2 [Funneliformis mosseae]|uniref:16525_t:CDS:1 n=1 Tax=Funneliformis mosseae TaxID=27381 RepID=A0A9N9BQL6_FUNMO|nr:16525_t:CDS:2 [Funneliformis mosseae]